MKKVLLTTFLFTCLTTFAQVKNTGVRTPEIKTEAEGDVLVGDIDIAPEGADTNEPFNFGALPVKPEYPGGYRLLAQQINDSLQIANLINITKGQQLKTTLSFIVERDGSISDIKILKDETFGYGKEVVRVFSGIKTKWKPGETTGKKVVRTYYILPFVYRIPE